MRVALLGYGMAGSVFHAPLIAAVPELELATIVTRGRRDQALADFPQARVVAEAAQAWEGCELAVMATPNDTHMDLARQALLAGLHVVVDKPLAPTSAQGQQLVELAAQQQRRLTVFHNRRWDGDFLTLQNCLPELGEVYRFESRFERWRPEIKPGWRETGDPAAAGGVLFDLGSHLIDQAIQLFGSPLSVYAETPTRRAQALVPDDVFVALRHRNGVQSHLWMSAVAANLGPRLRVLGSRGAYLKYALDIQEEQLKAGLKPFDPGFAVDPEERWGTCLGRPLPTLSGRYLEFYQKVAQGQVPVEAASAVEVLRVIEASQVAARERRVVQL